MQAKIKMYCGNCKFYWEINIAEQKGECHARPPSMIKRKDDYMPIRPEVIAYDIGCSKHRYDQYMSFNKR
jgi:hypothetical protein